MFPSAHLPALLPAIVLLYLPPVSSMYYIVSLALMNFRSVDAGTISLGVLFGVSVIVIVVLGFIIFRMHKQRYTGKTGLR